MATPPISYRNLIEEEFDTRKRKNPSYSLRAFARDLDMPPSKLSEVLRGICGLSTTSGQRIAKKLALSNEECAWFLQSIEAHHGRSKQGRLRAKEKLEDLKDLSGFDELAFERFKIISDWQHFALLELTEIHGFSADPEWIAQRLGISVQETKATIQRLLDFGLLREDAKRGFVQTHVDLTVPGGLPSREIRKHHAQILQKSLEALEEVPVDERDFSAITMAIPQSELPEARRLIKEFRRNFDRLLKKSKSPKDRVYALAIQFAPLERPHSQNSQKGNNHE
jgi:uncharacterized protein (TIGR02147 family)